MSSETQAHTHAHKSRTVHLSSAPPPLLCSHVRVALCTHRHACGPLFTHARGTHARGTYVCGTHARGTHACDTHARGPLLTHVRGRNPLSCISQTAEYILGPLRSVLPADILTEMLSISACLSHLQMLLKNVLSLDKLLNGSFTLPKEAFNPSHVLGAVVAMAKHSTQNDSVQLKLEVCPKVSSLMVEGAPMQLSLILLNLVSNATKFTTKGQVLLRADVVGEQEDDVQIK